MIRAQKGIYGPRDKRCLKSYNVLAQLHMEKERNERAEKILKKILKVTKASPEEYVDERLVALVFMGRLAGQIRHDFVLGRKYQIAALKFGTRHGLAHKLGAEFVQLAWYCYQTGNQPEAERAFH